MSQRHENKGSDTRSAFVPQNEKFVPKIDSKDPKLLDTMARRYTSIVGELDNVKTLLCCLISKDLPRKYRTSAIISNKSSTGKSYLLNTVLEPFREQEDSVLDFTDITEAYLKRAIPNVNGKIIKIEQLENRNDKGQLSFYKFKHLLSEGRLSFAQYDSDETDKNKKAKLFEVIGIPIIVSTTTEFDIDSETQNRFFMMQLDEGDEQTSRIIKHTLSTYTKPDSIEKNISDLADFYKKLAKMARATLGILIPFVDKIEDRLPKNLEMRRDLNKILNLTCVIAFIHAQNRDRLVSFQQMPTSSYGECESVERYYIIAKPEDFTEAINIAGDTIKQTINKMSHSLMAIHALVRKIHGEKALEEEQGVLVKELTTPTSLSENRIREYLNKLIDSGFVYRDDAVSPYKYYPEEKKFSELGNAIIDFSDEEYHLWLNTQDTTLNLVPSCDSKGGQNEL